ncbi:hypothetical protein RWH44_11995 [Microbacterium sp. KSW2-29]|uniref:DUF916 domain-containing protein n=1 Tax=Microbacterium phycohabitans TaxID=3075993 RepID=A0ABU3SNK3_9MICO|nr:hypothetical protein [Microbacterium sp. KSW2-29]MDU0346419.1 hypothetical protein [Microbacterium sp. KSW2-29]
MSRARRPRPVGIAVARAVLALAVVAGSLGLGSAASADDSGTLTVTITDGSTTPSPSPIAPAGGGPGSAAGGSSGSGSTSVSGVRSVPAPASGAGGGSPAGGGSAPTSEVSIAGMLYVGGLNASAAPAVDPTGGVVDVWFTIRNASSTPIDATADFWMDTSIFPQRLDAVDDVAVTALQPGETRVVSARLQHGGQWTLLSTHVTVTPPDSVDGMTLTPVTRDALALMFPWVLISLLVLVVVSVALVEVIRGGLRRAAIAVAVTP